MDPSTLQKITFTDHLLHNYVIHEIIFMCLTPLESLRLARTCQLARDAVHAFLKRTFDINRSLLRFFLDPISFRSMQARTGTLISGSFALQFFDRTFYPDSDLDLYLYDGKEQEVTVWMEQIGRAHV